MLSKRFSSFAVAGLVLACAGLAGCGEAGRPDDAATLRTEPAAPPEPVNERQAEIEKGLIPLVTVRGETHQSFDERMAHFDVRSVSVAVFRDGELDWAKGYGKRADTETIYQAASLSKAVAAVGIVTLARELGVSLDEDISGSLEGVDMKVLNPKKQAITLRGLLSHTNGATVSGFPGYGEDETLPSSLQVVTGSDITNTDPVTIEPNPDGDFAYAGGGYQLSQLWAEQASGESFSELMDRLVLEPVGMTRSTFAIRLPADLKRDDNVAIAYNWDGSRVRGGWHRYPEQAAAGLWTTPSDYGRFMLALMGAMQGEADTGIDPDVAADITAPVSETYGLGIGVQEKQDEMLLRHSGSNKGYKSYVEGFPDRGDVIIAMSGSESGFFFISDIVRTAKQIYGWPALPPKMVDRLALDEAQLAAYAGRYGRSDAVGREVVISAEGGDLVWTSAEGASYRLVPVTDSIFIDPDDGQEAVFERNGDGVMTLSAGGVSFERLSGS